MRVNDKIPTIITVDLIISTSLAVSRLRNALKIFSLTNDGSASSSEDTEVIVVWKIMAIEIPYVSGMSLNIFTLIMRGNSWSLIKID
jgi:hypothetical protein